MRHAISASFPDFLRPFAEISVLICERPNGRPLLTTGTDFGEVMMQGIREAVRKQYGKIAATRRIGDRSFLPRCCSGNSASSVTCTTLDSGSLGYSEQDLSSVPNGADLGLGCGNPQAIAALKPGETVLDLGSGGGLDCFLAAKQVGETGRVIGVDMTAEMIDRARKNARDTGTPNVEFRLGEIEHLPVADQSIDVILSNCVINLSTDKAAVFRDVFRVLRSGGRLAISDIVATAPLPDDVRDNIELYVGCGAGAVTTDELRNMLTDAGFAEIRITPNEASRSVIRDTFPGTRLEDFLVSATIEAIRP